MKRDGVDLLPINRTSHISKKSITLENDGYANQANSANSYVTVLWLQRGRDRGLAQTLSERKRYRLAEVGEVVVKDVAFHDACDATNFDPWHGGLTKE